VKPRAAAVHDAAGREPALTLTLPVAALAGLTVQAAPPGLITKRNAAHLGMSGAELLRVLRAMLADPRFRDAVVRHGKSFRAAAPEDIIAYLRAAPLVAAAQAADDGIDHELLREAGFEMAPPERRAR
jgi:hypothetical protein